MQGGYGFARGFDEWTDTPYAADTDIERTFGRGVESLSRLTRLQRSDATLWVVPASEVRQSYNFV